MSEKTISVPVGFYQLLAALAGNYLEWLIQKSDRSANEDNELARLVRWSQWNAAADERGLTRL